MAHNTSGLPPLDIEPFDAAPLYAAASSPERRAGPSRDRRQLVRVVGLALALVVIVAVVAGAIALR